MIQIYLLVTLSPPIFFIGSSNGDDYLIRSFGVGIEMSDIYTASCRVARQTSISNFVRIV